MNEFQFQVIDKIQTPIIPEGTERFVQLNSEEELLKYFKVNWKSQRAFLIFKNIERLSRPEKIYNFLFDEIGVTKEEILGIRRVDEIIFARQFMEYALFEIHKLTRDTISKEMGIHRTTIYNSIKVIEECIETDNGWRKKTINKYLKTIKN